MSLVPETPSAALIAWGGFAVAFVFGFVANRSNFCTMGAVSDVINMGDWVRMRMWLTAIAVAILGTQGLHAAGLIDLTQSFYTRPQLTWFSHILGGAMFGFGMVLAGGCGSKTLVRLGGGSLKALVVFFVMGVAAYMTLKGLFGVWRVKAIDPVAITIAGGQDLPRLFAGALGGSAKTVALVLAALVGVAVLAFAFKDKHFRASPWQWVGGIAIGLVIAAGWYITGHLGFGEDAQTMEMRYFGTNSRTLESLSYTAPMGYTLELLMLWSDASLKVTFGIAAAVGLIVGSFAAALTSRQFRWEGFNDTEDTANHIVGGVLMGFGGVLALGCTVGQGLSGLSTLSIGSIITFACIIAGAIAALKYQIWRLERMA